MQLRFEGALVAMTTDANEKTQLRYFRVGAPPYSTAQVRMLPLLDHGRNENDYYFSFGRLLPEIVASPLDRFRAVGLHEARRRLVLQKVSSVALPVSVPLSHTIPYSRVMREYGGSYSCARVCPGGQQRICLARERCFFDPGSMKPRSGYASLR